MQDFRKLQVWEKSHLLVVEIYQQSGSFPKSETFGLTSQLRRAVSSIPANIAEGCGRQGGADFARFLQVAMGSASETEYHLLLARDLGYLDEEAYGALNQQVLEIKRMLTSLMVKVRARANAID